MWKITDIGLSSLSHDRTENVLNLQLRRVIKIFLVYILRDSPGELVRGEEINHLFRTSFALKSTMYP